jgi:hypothetical protein
VHGWEGTNLVALDGDEAVAVEDDVGADVDVEDGAGDEVVAVDGLGVVEVVDEDVDGVDGTIDGVLVEDAGVGLVTVEIGLELVKGTELVEV